MSDNTPEQLEEIEGYAIDYDRDVKHLSFADICTDEIKIVLLTHSNMASPEEEFVIEDVGLPFGMNQEYFEICALETSFTKSRWNMVTSDNPEPERTPPPEPPFEKQDPDTKIEVMFGDRLSNQLVPVIITEVTTNADDLNKITVWNFDLIGHSGGNRYVTWDVLSKDKRIGYEITKADTGLDIVNCSDESALYVIPLDPHGYEMNCGLFWTVNGESTHPTTFPIHNTHTILAKNSRMGIFPYPNG